MAQSEFELVIDDGDTESRKLFTSYEEARDAWREADKRVQAGVLFSAEVLEVNENCLRPKRRLYCEYEHQEADEDT